VYTEALNKSVYYTAIVSSPNIIYNGGGNPMTLTSATVVILVYILLQRLQHGMIIYIYQSLDIDRM
jgi:hypothetical protein